MQTPEKTITDEEAVAYADLDRPQEELPVTKYGREINMEELLRKRGVRLMCFMDGEFSETPRNRAERRAAEEQLTSVARMQIRRKMETWGGKKVAVA